MNDETVFVHLKGNYMGKAYDFIKPPKVLFKIIPIGKKYVTFIHVCDTLYAKIKSEAIRVIVKHMVQWS